MTLSKQQQTTLGSLVVIGIFGGLIYNASEQKHTPTAVMENAPSLPIILPVAETQLPPLTEESITTVLNQDWSALEPDGIPLLEIAPVEDAELPPLES
jgi:uncharacterized membrane protein YebE (DUF533 family)